MLGDRLAEGDARLEPLAALEGEVADDGRDHRALLAQAHPGHEGALAARRADRLARQRAHLVVHARLPRYPAQKLSAVAGLFHAGLSPVEP